MNKKGFTLVEILAVVVILALVGVLVSTNGFGAFNNISKKVELEDEKTILASANLIGKEILDCDDSLDSDFVKDFYYIVEGREVSDKNCSDIKNEGCHTLSLERMLEKNFISGSNLNKYLKKYKNDETKKEYIAPEVCISDDRIVINPSKTVEDPKAKNEIVVNDKQLNLFTFSNNQVRDKIYTNIKGKKYISDVENFKLDYNFSDNYLEKEEKKSTMSIDVKVNNDAIYVQDEKTFDVNYYKILEDNIDSFKNIFNILQKKTIYEANDEVIYEAILPTKVELIDVAGTKYFKFTYSEKISDGTRTQLQNQKNYIYLDNDIIKEKKVMVYDEYDKKMVNFDKYDTTNLEVSDGTFALLNDAYLSPDQELALMQNKYYIKKKSKNLQLYDAKNNYDFLSIYGYDASFYSKQGWYTYQSTDDNSLKKELNDMISNGTINGKNNSVRLEINSGYIKGSSLANIEYIDVNLDSADYVDFPKNRYYFSTLSNTLLYNLIFNKKYDNVISLREFQYDSDINHLEYKYDFYNIIDEKQKEYLNDFINNVKNYKTNETMYNNIKELQLKLINSFVNKPSVKENDSYQEIPSSDYDVYYDYSRDGIYYVIDLNENSKYESLKKYNALYSEGKFNNIDNSYYNSQYIENEIFKNYSNSEQLVIWFVYIDLIIYDSPYYLTQTVDLTYDENSRNYYFPHLENFKSFSYNALRDSFYHKPKDSSENIGITVDSTPFLKALAHYLKNGDDCQYCSLYTDDADYCSSYYNGNRVYTPYAYYQRGGSYIFTISHLTYLDFLRTNEFSTNLNIIPYERYSEPHYYYDDYFTITDTNYERVRNSDSSDSYYKVGYNSSGNELSRDEISESTYYEKTGAAPDGGR